MLKKASNYAEQMNLVISLKILGWSRAGIFSWVTSSSNNDMASTANIFYAGGS